MIGGAVRTAPPVPALFGVPLLDQDCRRPRDRHLPGAQLRHPEDRDRRRRPRPRRRHAERPRAGGGQLSRRPRHPLPDRPRRAPDRGHLAVPLPRRLLAARAGDDGGDRRGRHGALGHQGQGRRPAALPAAGRREPRGRDGLRPRQRHRHRRDHRRGARYLELGYKAIRLQSGVPGPRQAPMASPRTRYFYEPADARLPTENVWSTREVPAHRARSCSRRRATVLGLGRPPAARRPPSPDADRGGAARQGARALSPFWLEDATPAENQAASA